jgi:hypothetical protein
MYMGYAGVGPIFFAVDRYYYSTNRTDVGGAESFETRYDGNNIRPSTLMGPGHTKHQQLHVPVNLTTVYVRICDDSGVPALGDSERDDRAGVAPGVRVRPR